MSPPSRLATVVWRTAPPTSVDEELAVFDDGTALLVVRRGRHRSAAVGTYECRPTPEDLAALEATGPKEVEFDLRALPEDAALMAIADRVAELARQTPLAVAEFFVRALPSSGGLLSLSLLVSGAGTNAVEFELNPQSSAVHFFAGEGEVSWQEFPALATGFVTPEAEGLGGLGRAGRVEPGRYGAIALEVPPDPGATSVVIQVGGWLRGTPPDRPMPEPFEARTAPAELTS